MNPLTTSNIAVNMKYKHIQSTYTNSFVLILLLLGIMTLSCSDDRRTTFKENEESVDMIQTHLDMPTPNDSTNNQNTNDHPRDMPNNHKDIPPEPHKDMPKDTRNSYADATMRKDTNMNLDHDNYYLEVSCLQGGGEVISIDGVEVCIFHNRDQCPKDFKEPINTPGEPILNFRACTKTKSNVETREVIETLRRNCQDNSQHDECDSRGVLCKDEGSLYHYDSSSRTCTQKEDGWCLLIIEDQNATSCWIRKNEDGTVEFFYGFGIPTIPWSEGQCSCSM